jgi:hypothetical protein
VLIGDMNGTGADAKILPNQSSTLITGELQFFQNGENDEAWVAADTFQFLVGQDRKIGVRFQSTQELVGATYTWSVRPIGTHSGTVAQVTETTPQIEFQPAVTGLQRPVDGSRTANPAIRYEVHVDVALGELAASRTAVIVQDEPSVIRQEYLDFRTFKVGFTLEVPERAVIVMPTHDIYRRGNYQHIVDRNAVVGYERTLAAFGAPLTITSMWRNPRRNVAVNGTVNSRHQLGEAVDMHAANRDTVDRVARRRDFLNLFRAANGAQGRVQVLLERGAAQLLPGAPAYDVPPPSEAHPDTDNDGLPDDLTGPGPYTRLLSAIFNDATHVHLTME